MDVNVLSFADGRYDSTDVLTVFNDCIAEVEVAKRDFMPDRHGVLEGATELTVVLSNHAQQVCADREIFDDHDTDIVATIVHKQVRHAFHGLLRVLRQVSHRI
jgi:hypothetical protein